jgi:uncharacterized lipoprotein YmbA
MIAVKRFLPMLLPVLLCGCSLEHPYPSKEFYVLESAELDRVAIATPVVIEVGRAQIAPPFDTRVFQYRVGEARYEPTYYAQWASDPGSLVAQSVSRSIASTGAFVIVGDASGADAPSLQIEVTDLYADVREPGATTAVVAIRATMLDSDGGVLVLREVRREIPSASDQPADIVSAWARGVGDALKELVPELLAAFDDAE